MAEPVYRETVSDPLAFNPRAQGADRSLPTYGVRNPQQSAGTAATKEGMQRLSIIDGLQAALGQVAEAGIQDAVTEGKLMQMQGATEEAVRATGNKYTYQGYQALSAVDKASRWFTEEVQFIQEQGQQLSPEEYRKTLMERRKTALDNLPDDPAVRRAYTAAFENFGPRLVQEQVVRHNEYNTVQAVGAFSSALLSGAETSEDASVEVEDGFRISEAPVAPAMQYSDQDRDVAIRTILGEAGGEGPQGMAAVAHVLKNRANDSRWGGSIRDVALAPKQFSAWNKGAGGNNPSRYNPESRAYQKAGAIFDAVMQGKHVDPTGGATHYFSPGGMKALVAEGSQSNTIPTWLDQERAKSGGEIRIGNHIFVGKASRSAKSTNPTTTGYVDPYVSAPNYNPDAASLPADNAAVVQGAETPAERTSRIQAFIRNSPLKREHKATALSDAMRRQLEEGNDQLFNDTGGIAMLRALGAKPSEIDEVLRAKDRFESEKDKQFDVTYEKGRAELLSRVQSQEFATMEDALNAVDEFHQQYGGSHSEAKSLARQVASDWAKAGDDAIVPIELRNLGASLYDQLENGALTAEEAGEQIIQFSKENGIKASVANNFVASMYSTAKAKKDRDRTEAKTEIEKQQKEKQVIAQVDTALARGFGLKGLQGRVRIPDSNIPGGMREVSGEEYGIWKLKKSVQDQYMQDVASGRIKPDEAAPMMNKDVYEKLAAQGVPDTKFGQELAAAVSGDFIQNGVPNDSALQAMDFYMQMRDNPSVGSQYLSTMLSDEARTLFETASNLYDGRLSLEGALTKAHALLNDPLDPPKKIEKSAAFYAQVNDGVQKAVQNLTNEGGFLTALMGSKTFRKADVDAAISNDSRAKAYISSRAETYHLLNPREPINVSIKKAADDLANNAILVGSEIVVGNFAKGHRLDQRMGIEALGKDAPQKALTAALQNYGPQWWGAMWNDRVKRGVFTDRGESITGADGRATSMPPYRVTYQPEQGILEVELYKDSARTETVGEPLILDVKREIGDPFKAQAKIGEGNAMLDAWRGYKETVVDALKWDNGQDAAESIGSMINQ